MFDNAKPILFSTPMVQALLDGRKTQTRRVMKGQPQGGANITEEFARLHNTPRYKVGDILYVRETWCELWKLDNNDQCIEGTQKYYYRADGANPTPFNHFLDNGGHLTREYPLWRPSLFMPKAAARIFLEITSVRAERVQQITNEDAAAEGVYQIAPKLWHYEKKSLETHKGTFAHSPKQAFMWLWDMINGRTAAAWGLDPWVWVYTLKRVEV